MGKLDKQDDLGRIIDVYQDSLFRFAFFRIGSLADSQDIVQNVFLKMYEDRFDISKIDNLKNYLFRCISNSCSNYLRKKKTHSSVSLDSIVVKTAEEDTDEIAKEYERIAKMMESIPEEQAEVIRMRTIDSLAFTEIADILDIPVTTVKSRFKYGVDKLKSKTNKIK